MGENGKGYMLSLRFFPGGQFGNNPLVWAILFLLATVFHCGVPTQAAGQSSEYVAQIMLQVDQVIEPAAARALPPNDWQQIEQQTGAQFIKSEGVLRFPPRPAAGYWLKVSIHRYQIDKEGYIRTPSRPPVTRNLSLFIQVGDTDPFGVIPRVQFVQAGQTPPPTIVKLKQKLPLQMNPDNKSTGPNARNFELPDSLNARFQTLEYSDSGPLSCIRPVLFQGPGDFPPGPIGAKCARKACAPGNAPPGCCLDYDGIGDGKPVNRKAGPVCAAVGYIKFTNSTCYKWTFENFACINESALFWNNQNPKKKAPNCYQNHKYRNCQNLNMYDLNLIANKTEIKFGESVNLKLRNNTPGNFTCLAVSTPAGAKPPSVTNVGKGGFIKSTDCGGYRASHFTDSPKKHYEDMSLRFTAPAAPPQGSCKVLYKLTATNGGPGLAPPFNTWITVRKSSCLSEWTGWIKLVYKESGEGDQPLKFKDEYEEKQTWTIIQRVADQPDLYEATWEIRADGEETDGEGCNTDINKVHDGATKHVRLSIYEEPGVKLQVRLVRDMNGNELPLQKQFTTSRNVNCTKSTEAESLTIFPADWGNDIVVSQPGDSVADSKTLEPDDPGFPSGWLMESDFSSVTKKATLSWNLTRVH